MRRFFSAKLVIPLVLTALAVPIFYPFLFGWGLLSPPDKLDAARDKRVAQFIRGEAGDRLVEIGEQSEG